MKIIAEGLRFPEGPIAMDDGSIVFVEIDRGTLSRLTSQGEVEVVADLGGGPNGAAIGPDGLCYVCNNGGFHYHNINGMLIPGDMAEDYSGGRIERVDLATGKSEVLYTECDGIPLRGPNDIVFDKQGGFWFTDHGKGSGRVRDRGALFYARTDGSEVREVVFPLVEANGVGLSPDEDYVYVAETVTARLWRFKITAPGEIENIPPFYGECLYGAGGHQFYDSLAVTADGYICVATIRNSGITEISPDGSSSVHHPFPDPIVTNICFGGADLKTATICLSATGKLVQVEWERPGLPLNFLNT